MGATKESSEAIISHLGRNPVRGGSPPKDRRRRDSVRRLRKLDITVDEKSFGVLEFRKKR
jgi:hypothetical protein